MANWSFKNIKSADAPGIVGSAGSGATAGTQISPGWGTVIGGIVGLGVGIGRAGQDGTTKITTRPQIVNDHAYRGQLRDPMGGGATWDYDKLVEKRGPKTGLWDALEMGIQVAGVVGGQMQGAEAAAEGISMMETKGLDIPGPPSKLEPRSSGLKIAGMPEPTLQMYMGHNPNGQPITRITGGSIKAEPGVSKIIGPGRYSARPVETITDTITGDVFTDPTPKPKVHLQPGKTTITEGHFAPGVGESIHITPDGIAARPVQPQAPLYEVSEQMPVIEPESAFDFGEPIRIAMEKISPRKPRSSEERIFHAEEFATAPQHGSEYVPRGPVGRRMVDSVPGYPHIKRITEPDGSMFYENKAGQRMPYSAKPEFEHEFIYGGVEQAQSFIEQREQQRRGIGSFQEQSHELDGIPQDRPKKDYKSVDWFRGLEDPLWNEWLSSIDEFTGDYQLGAKGMGNVSSSGKKTDEKSIDCSGILCKINEDLGWDRINVGSMNIRDQFDTVLDIDDLSHGDLIYVATPRGRANHIAQVLIHPETGERYIAESASSPRKDGKTGIRVEPFDSRIDSLREAGTVEFGRINKIYNKYN